MTAATWDWLPTDETPIAGAALRYAEHGLRVFPCYAVVNGRCTCGKADCDRPGKHPATRTGVKDASSDPAVVSRWQWAGRNIGLATGNGLIVLDVDGPEGAESVANLETEHGSLPETLRSSTGKGEHLLFHTTDSASVRNKVRIARGLDVRSDGGYIIAAPSLHASGARYRWSNRSAPAPAPAWLIGVLTKPPKKPGNGAPPSKAPSERPDGRSNGAPPSKAPGKRATAWAGSALRAIVGEISNAAEGERNSALNRGAFRVGQLIGGGLLDEATAADELRRAGLACGLAEGEVETVLRPLGGLDVGKAIPARGPAPVSARGPASVSAASPATVEDQPTGGGPTEGPEATGHAPRPVSTAPLGDIGQEGRQSVTELLLSLVSVTDLYQDESGEVFAHVYHGERRELLPIRGSRFREWIVGTYFEKEEETAGSEAINSAIEILAFWARERGEVTLWNRVAPGADGAIWIDMADKARRAIRVDGEGWHIVDQPPPMFRHHSHQAPLPEPVRGGNARLFEKHIKLTSERDSMLFTVSAIVALIPNIPQWALICYGPQGSSKSTAARFRRSVVDPTRMKSTMTPAKQEEFIQALAHHYQPLFDNVRSVPLWMADILSQAATGGGFTKRKLYTDGDDFFYSFTRSVCVTAVHVPTQAPDLLDRSILLPFERIPDEERAEESEVVRAFEADRSSIFGGMLDALSAAIRRYPDIKPGRLPRMADCARWGAAVADVLGFGAQVFLDALEVNARRQATEALRDEPVAAALISFVRPLSTWRGTPTQLLDELNLDRGDGAPAGRWPKTPAVFGRRLVELGPALASLGLHVERERGDERNYVLTWRGSK
jgi:hypothetical protein